MACDGVAYPVQIQIEMRVQNRSVDVSAEGSFLPGTAETAIAAKANICRLVPDIIRGQAQCTAFYTKVVELPTEFSGTTFECPGSHSVMRFRTSYPKSLLHL